MIWLVVIGTSEMDDSWRKIIGFDRNFLTRWWMEHDFYSSIPLGMSSSQLTNSYVSERWLNHQPDRHVWAISWQFLALWNWQLYLTCLGLWMLLSNVFLFLDVPIAVTSPNSTTSMITSMPRGRPAATGLILSDVRLHFWINMIHDSLKLSISVSYSLVMLCVFGFGNVDAENPPQMAIWRAIEQVFGICWNIISCLWNVLESYQTYYCKICNITNQVNNCNDHVL